MAIRSTSAHVYASNGAHTDSDSDSDGDDASHFLEAADWEPHPSAVAAQDGHDDDNAANDGGSESDNADGDGESWHDAPELADLIEQATAHKTVGNAHFAAQKNHAALEAYRAGLDCLPERKEPPKRKLKGKGKGKARADLAEDDFDGEDSDSGASATSEQRASHGKHDPAQKAKATSSQLRALQDDEDEKEFFGNGQNGMSEEEKQVVELRATLWSNLAATQLRLSLYTEAAKSASEALKDKPAYVKALQRRATANEKLNTWTSLSAALEDYTLLSELPGTPDSLKPSVRLALRTLPPRIEERKGVETKEMMDKLKGLGNSFLGKFGISTDNFQFVKNEETGGYSMNFTQTPPKK